MSRHLGLLTTRETADALGVTVDTVTRWWTEGRIEEAESPRPGRPRMFDQETVDHFRERPRPRRLHDVDLTAITDERFLTRFWEKVDKNGPVPEHHPELGPCWVWTRHLVKAGYGQFTVSKGIFRLAHIVSYALTNGGVIRAGMYVCHHCDNPACVNPAHLFLGSQAANVRDMFAKGRQGSRHPGTERHNARLTEDDVRAIRATPAYHGRKSALARQYGVSNHRIGKILAGKAWRHVA